jgi:hypothetical protein
VAVLVYPVSLASLPPEAASEIEARASAARASLQRAGWQVFVIEPDGRLTEAWNESMRRKARAAVSSY